MRGSVEMRSVHLTQASIKEYMKQLKEYSKEPFGSKVDSAASERSRQIAESPAALKLISEGYPRYLAHRVAKLQKEGHI